MHQVRPYMRDSVKNLEKVFTEYAFNKKVLTAVHAELGFRTTKSAAALLLKVQQRLEEIEKKDRFGREKSVKGAPPVTPSQAQLPLLETPVAKPARVDQGTTPPKPPRPEPAAVSSPPTITTPPPVKLAAQAKVKAEADRAVSVSLVGLSLLAVILIFAFFGKKLTDDSVVHRANSVPNTYKHVPLYTKPRVSPIFFDESPEWPQQREMSPQARAEGDIKKESTGDEYKVEDRILYYKRAVDALLN
ncbi:hypothetical protein [Desulfovibrio intestinalis]|uniref:Uncharacterized protein n=1 Tax=Desulfovibrio intestinalis TaxID=58621 RepID=A0A7W8FGM5_9BACT|nr:hypothetical protein [Desulfovibrio intestinalis]MBB5143960.1 hypothetical protein [Desulfovibrio intestinalis]